MNSWDWAGAVVYVAFYIFLALSVLFMAQCACNGCVY